MADLASEGDAFAGSGLGALVQEDTLGAVNDICLNAGDVDVPLDFRDPDDIVVGRSADLDKAVILVAEGTV